jgi:TRAP-type uncharacterized transport system fused permease subunit
MGLPTSAAYLLLAVLVAPALTRLGMPPLSAHMFIFYFGLVSAITPPVALAAYAAASIAGSSPNETAVESMRLGFVKLLVPFLFVTMPGLLLIGNAWEIVGAIALATIATTSLSIGLAGWLGRGMSGWERWVFILAALMVAWPTNVANLDPAIVTIRLLGIAATSVMAVRFWLELNR